MGVSTQAKLFAGTFAVGFAAEFVGEVLMARQIPGDRAALKSRFWIRYVIGAACAAIIGTVLYIVVDVLAKVGWTRLAWAMALVPTVLVLGVALTLQGVNTVLDESSGSGCLRVVGMAYRQKKTK